MAAINPLTHKFIAVYSNPDQTQEVLMIHLLAPENRTLLHMNEYMVYSIGYEYINNQLLAFSYHRKTEEYEIIQITQSFNGTSDAKVKVITKLRIDGKILMSSFHLYKSLFYLTIITEKNVYIFDIERTRVVTEIPTPKNIHFDAIQLNTELRS